MGNYIVEERRFGPAGRSIYGKLWLPVDVEHPQLIIYAHEIGCTHRRAEPYAKHLAERGLAVFAPDFRGGGERSRSEGGTVDMSVLTEVEDLADVAAEAGGWSFVSGSAPILMGGSQGGFVCAIFAGRNPGAVAAQILLYPAFDIPDAIKRGLASPMDAPEKQYFHGWLWMGRRYFVDMWDYEPYSEPMRYGGPVLILHGDRDGIVPLAYARKAAELYKDARLEVIPGAEHMFKGGEIEAALGHIDGFLSGLGYLK